MKRATVLFAGVFMLCSGRAGAQPPHVDWVQQVSGTERVSAGLVATDTGGDILTAGFFAGTVSIGGTTLTSAGENDVFLARYHADGSLAWAQQAGGTRFDGVSGMAIDSLGNVIISGHFGGSATFGGVTLTSAGSNDVFLAKYDPGGSLLWARRAGGSANDVGNGVAVDGAENIILTGGFTGSADFDGTTVTSAGSVDFFIAKFTPGGSLVWIKTGGGASVDLGFSVAAEFGGGYVCAGQFRESAVFGAHTLTSSGERDGFLARYDPVGALISVDGIGGSSDDLVLDVAVDALDNHILSGGFQGTVDFAGTVLTSDGRYDSFLAKYDPAMNFMWVRQGSGPLSQLGDGVTVDAAGNIFQTGFMAGPSTFGDTLYASVSDTNDIFLAGYNEHGSLRWFRRFGGLGPDRGSDVALGAAGAILLSGHFTETVDFDGDIISSAGEWDGFVARLGDATAEVVARVGCAPRLPETCTITAPVVVDVSGTSPAELLGSFTGRLAWDPSKLRYAGDSSLLSGFTGLVNRDNTDSGELVFNGANPTGKDGVVKVLSAAFMAIGAVGDSTVLDMNFEAMSGAVPTFTNLLPVLSVADTSVRIAGTTDVPDQAAVPVAFALLQNYPNPFSGGKDRLTRIDFDVPAGITGAVSLSIYDIQGHLVRRLVDGEAEPGRHTASWDGANSAGVRVASGVFFVKMMGGDFVAVRKMMVAR